MHVLKKRRREQNDLRSRQQDASPVEGNKIPPRGKQKTAKPASLPPPFPLRFRELHIGYVGRGQHSTRSPQPAKEQRRTGGNPTTTQGLGHRLKAHDRQKLRARGREGGREGGCPSLWVLRARWRPGVLALKSLIF